MPLLLKGGVMGKYPAKGGVDQDRTIECNNLRHIILNFLPESDILVVQIAYRPILEIEEMDWE